jgi:stage II sporulation protein D
VPGVPGAPSAPGEPHVRVFLGRAERVRIASRRGVEVVDGSGERLLRDNASSAAEVSVAVDGLAWNGASLARTRIDVLPLGDIIEADGVAYRGRLRLILDAEGRIAIINELPIEQYLQGVLRGELPRRFGAPAQRAMVIAARTYALFQCGVMAEGSDYDLYAGERSQVYRGVAGEDRDALEAVRRTRGVVLTCEQSDQQRIFEALYSSTCGGATASAEAFSGRPAVGPLEGSVRCSYCAAADSPFLSWPDVRMAGAVVWRRLSAAYPSLRGLERIERIGVAERNEHGRPTLLRLSGAQGRERTLRPERLRVAVAEGRIRSSWFDVREAGDDFVFSDGHGFGHGVGLCQYGAEGMARTSKSAAEILAYYYPGSRLARAY